MRSHLGVGDGLYCTKVDLIKCKVTFLLIPARRKRNGAKMCTMMLYKLIDWHWDGLPSLTYRTAALSIHHNDQFLIDSCVCPELSKG